MGEASPLPAPVARILDALLAAVVAPACAACSRPLEHPAQSAVCTPCLESIPLILPPVCERCGEPLASWRAASIAERRCPRCRRRPAVVTAARAAGTYDGTLRALLHAFKFGGRRSLAGPLAALIRRRAGDMLADAECVVPVPLHWWRRRRRGFNQAEELAVRLGPPLLVALRRVRPTCSQAQLPAARRHANVRGAFAVARGVDVAGRIIVLVDDVCTTGATLDACARELLAAGAAEVRAVTAARAVARTT